MVEKRMAKSNLGAWDGWYANLDETTPSAFRNDDTETYRIAADFLKDCATVEDWGCGAGVSAPAYRPCYLYVDGKPCFWHHPEASDVPRGHQCGDCIHCWL